MTLVTIAGFPTPFFHATRESPERAKFFWSGITSLLSPGVSVAPGKREETWEKRDVMQGGPLLGGPPQLVSG